MGRAEVTHLDDWRSQTRARPAERARCRAATSSGRPCRNVSLPGSDYCRVHRPASEVVASAPRPGGARLGPREGLAETFERLDDFLRRRLAGDYRIDDFGYDEDLWSEILLPPARALFERYFRGRALGVDRIPDGAAMVVANHSGTIALDAVMLQAAIAAYHPQHRVLRNVGADLVFRLPFIGPLARKSGNVVACDEDAYELLRRGELMGVFPEGYKGVGKGWRERYKLQRFGRGGFVETALRARVPVVPVAIIGAEEAYPMIANLKPLAHLFGFPYFPVTPTFPLLGPLGLVPLPSRWLIEVGEPIDLAAEYPPEAADDPMLVFDLTDRVRDTIQQMIFKNLQLRRGAFF